MDKPRPRWQFRAVSAGKLSRLHDIIRSTRSALVAYSGGVDSAFLARVTHDLLGNRTLAVIADSPSLPRRELAEALALGKAQGFPVRVIRTHEFDNAQYLENTADRCYFCKHDLFAELVPIARAEGFEAIYHGENASDIGDHRPGARAAAEFSVRAPLKEAGLTKEEIRTLSATLGLPTADKPQMACLSSRVPYGEKVTPAKLRMIEDAESVLRDLGFRDVRVRHHELKPGPGMPEPALARLELGPAEIPRFMAQGVFLQVAQTLRAVGYQHVTLDLLGYRRGSVNEPAVAPTAPPPHPSSPQG